MVKVIAAGAGLIAGLAVVLVMEFWELLNCGLLLN